MRSQPNACPVTDERSDSHVQADECTGGNEQAESANEDVAHEVGDIPPPPGIVFDAAHQDPGDDVTTENAEEGMTAPNTIQSTTSPVKREPVPIKTEVKMGHRPIKREPGIIKTGRCFMMAQVKTDVAYVKPEHVV